MANYPSSEASANRYLPPLDDARRTPPEPPRQDPDDRRRTEEQPRITVTRAAAYRSREMGSKMYGLVHRAATADGADNIMVIA